MATQAHHRATQGFERLRRWSAACLGISTIFLLLLLFPQAIYAQGIPELVNPPLPTGAGEVRDAVFAAGGQAVVARVRNDGLNRLYAFPVDGSSPIRLDLPIPAYLAHGDPFHVEWFIVSPDGQMVVFYKDTVYPDGSHMAYLYSVPVCGGEPHLIEEWEYSALSKPSHVLFLPDGQSLIYYRGVSHPAAGGWEYEIFRANLFTGDPVMIDHPDTIWGIYKFRLSPNGRYLLYEIRADYLWPWHELYSLRLSDNLVTMLAEAAYHNEVISTLEFHPNNVSVVYVADYEIDEFYELFRVPLTGDTPPTALASEQASTRDFHAQLLIPPAGDTIIARGKLDGVASSRIFTVPFQGGLPMPISGPTIKDGSVDDMALSHDGATVVFHSDKDVETVWNLYSVPLSGATPPVQLNPLLSGGRDTEGYKISPDDRWVVYHVDQNVAGQFEIYSVPLAGGAANRLNPPLVDGGDVYGASNDAWATTISPDSRRVIFVADAITNNIQLLYTAPISGGAALSYGVSPVDVDNEDNPVILASPDNTHLAYPTMPDDGLRRVVWADYDGNALRTFGGNVTTVGDVTSFVRDPDGVHLLYRADQDAAGTYELYRVAVESVATTAANGVTTVGAPVRLLPPLTGTQDVDDAYEISPDGAYVVFLADLTIDQAFELYSVPSTGGVPTKLHPDLGAQSDADHFWVTPDSRQVVFLADAETVGQPEIYSSPITASTWVKLNPPLAFYGMVYDDVAVSPDAQWVVYAADVNGDSRPEIYSNRVGESSATLLAGGAGAGQTPRLSTLHITPDSQSVVYIGDTDSGQATVYSTPISTSMPTDLSKMPDVDILAPLNVTADGERVVFAARDPLDIDGVIQLYSSPVGAGNATHLAEAYAYHDELFRLTGADDVIFLSLRDDNPTLRELLSVPAAGGSPTVLMSEASVGRYELTPVGDHVVFFSAGDLYITGVGEAPSTRLTFGADLDGGESLVINSLGNWLAIPMCPEGEVDEQLYLVSLEGNGYVSAIASPVPTGAAVTAFDLRVDGSVVYFIAESEGVAQLYRNDTPPVPADLYVEKQVTPSDVSVPTGAPITYTIRFGNRGGTAAIGAVISDTLPSEFAPTEVISSGAPITLVAGSTYRWQAGSLLPAASGWITITGTFPSEGAPPFMQVVNRVVVNADIQEVTTMNNASEVVSNVTIGPTPSPTPEPTTEPTPEPTTEPTPQPWVPTDFVYLPLVVHN